MKPEGKTRRLFWATVFLMVFNICLTILLLSGQSTAQTAYGRAKFMYKVVKSGSDEQSLQTIVDLFARDGWELVTHYNDTLIFKK